MLDAPDVRAHDSNGTEILVQPLNGGDFLVAITFGPVSIRVTVSPEAVGFLFAPAVSEERAA